MCWLHPDPLLIDCPKTGDCSFLDLVLIFELDDISFETSISVRSILFRQPRPFWVNPDVQMLEWNCYTEYGSPSGHSALVIVLLDFLVRFTFRWSQKLLRVRWLLYFLIFCFELLVMFSRVYLGMHSINQVILGLMIGVYSLIPYYLYFEKIIFKFCLYFLSS